MKVGGEYGVIGGGEGPSDTCRNVLYKSIFLDNYNFVFFCLVPAYGTTVDSAVIFGLRGIGSNSKRELKIFYYAITQKNSYKKFY